MPADPLPVRTWLDRALWGTAAAVSVLAAVAYLALAALRLSHPLELEWMEGGILDQVRIVRGGGVLYGPPAVEFTPFVYPPLYTWSVALLAGALPLSFALARAVSGLSMLAALALVWRVVRSETGDRLAATAALGLLAASYGLTGFWYDLARPDTLALALWLAALPALRRPRAPAWAVVGGLTLAASVLAKQTFAGVAVATLIGAASVSRRRASIAASTFLTTLAVLALALERASDGWFLYYVAELPARHGAALARAPELVLPMLARTGPALALAAAALALAPADAGRKLSRFYGPIVVAAVGTAALTRLHAGGYRNSWMPAAAALALAAGLLVGWSRRGETGADTCLPEPRGPGATTGRRARTVALVLWLQFGLLAYDPRDALPARGDRACAESLLARLRDLPENTWMPAGGFYRHLAGRQGLDAHAYALSDVFRAHGAERGDELRSELVERLRRQRYDAVVIGTRELRTLPAEVEAALRAVYVPAGRIFPDQRCAFPRSGYPTRPEAVLIPLRTHAPRAEPGVPP